MRLRVHFAGVGGQGTQTASRILGEAALGRGLGVLVAALHGMAQRGGAVINQVLIGDVRSPLIEPGEADVLVGFEPMETARSTPFVGPSTIVISSTSRIVPYVLTAAGGSYPSIDDLLGPVERICARMHRIDAASLAAGAGNALAIGPVMLGALGGLGALPFEARHLRETLAGLSTGSRRDVDLKAFDLGLRSTTLS